MAKLAVLILDLDKLAKDQWMRLWNGVGDYCAKINEADRQSIIDNIEKIQDERLAKDKGAGEK